MPIFQYRAFDEGGDVKTGVIDADTPRDARLKLRDQRLHVTELGAAQSRSASAAAAAGGGRRIRLFAGRVKLQDLALLTRQLATLLNSGIPILGALAALVEAAESATLKTVLMSIRERVSQGQNFSDALADYPSYFNDLFVNMVKAGEASGQLDQVLFRVADYIQTQNRLRQRIKAALTYPGIIVIVGIGVCAFLLMNVVPKILMIIQQRKIPMPLPTQILLGVSSFLGSFWWIVLLVVVGAYVGWRLWVRTEGGRRTWDGFLLRVPVLGSLLRKAAISRFSVTFATLLESGLPVLEALRVVAKVTNNQVITDALDVARRRIAEGSDIAAPLKASGLFPATVTHMIQVGEESGQLEKLLRKISEAYDEEIEIAAARLTAALEPLLIVGMAVFVGFIVLSVVLPILSMAQI